MPQIQPLNNASSVVDNVFTYAEVKRSWSDRWTFAPYPFPSRCRLAVAPECGSADFVYHTGEIKQADTNSLATYEPVDLRGWYGV